MNDQILFNGFTRIFEKYWLLATVEHFVILIILLLFWGNLKSKWRFSNRIISFYWFFTFSAVAYLFIITPGWTFVFFGVLISLPAIFFLVEFFFSTFDYTAENFKKTNVIVGIVLIILGIWYPAYSETWLEALVDSPLGVLPSSTLMVAQGMLIIIYPQVKRSLLWVLVLLGFFFGSTSLYRFHIYWDLVLVLGSSYGLKILTDKKKPVQLDLALEP